MARSTSVSTATPPPNASSSSNTRFNGSVSPAKSAKSNRSGLNNGQQTNTTINGKPMSSGSATSAISATIRVKPEPGMSPVKAAAHVNAPPSIAINVRPSSSASVGSGRGGPAAGSTNGRSRVGDSVDRDSRGSREGEGGRGSQERSRMDQGLENEGGREQSNARNRNRNSLGHEGRAEDLEEGARVNGNGYHKVRSEEGTFELIHPYVSSRSFGPIDPALLDPTSWVNWTPLPVIDIAQHTVVDPAFALHANAAFTSAHTTPFTSAYPTPLIGRSSIDGEGHALQPLPAVLSRPPIRPPIPSISKSKFELEPNPFDLSFSRSSTSINSHQTNSSEDVRQDMRDEQQMQDRHHHQHGQSTKTPPGKEKTALPPLSALTSPAPLEQGPHFSWSGLSSSLRAGPLSPAMLTGPAANNAIAHGPSVLGGTGMTPQPGVNGSGLTNFDPASFRTGFTPGGGTGFTPGFGSMIGMTGLSGIGMNGLPSFPLPSPNTAAFLNMVTNHTPGAAAGEGGNAHIGDAGQSSGAGQNGESSAQNTRGHARGGSLGGHAQAGPIGMGGPNPSGMIDITPNTLNALTGVINQMNDEEQEAERRKNERFAGHGPSQLGPGYQPQAHQHPPQGEQRGRMHHVDSYFPAQAMHGPGGPDMARQQNDRTGNPHQMHPGAMHQHASQGPPMTLPPSHLHAQPAAVDRNGSPTNGQGQDGAAVNGLFLLSQAHQEISKREEEEHHTDAPPPPPAKKGAKGTKRKSEDAGNAAASKSKPPAKKAKKGAQPSITSQPQETPSPEYLNSVNDGMELDEYDEADRKLMDLAGFEDEERGIPRKPETEEEKRKNFLERNRQAALKCRQRKKAWLGSLQTKVDGLTAENDRLRSIIQNLTDEVGRVSAVLSSHRDCPGMPASMAQLGITLPPPPPGTQMPGMMPPGMMGHPPSGGPHGPPGGYRHGSVGSSSYNGHPQAQVV